MPKTEDKSALTEAEMTVEEFCADDVYINGFSIAIGTGDIRIALLRNEQVVQNLMMSYTVAKTLLVALGRSMTVLEELTGNEIMTTHYVTEKLSAGAIDHDNT